MTILLIGLSLGMFCQDFHGIKSNLEFSRNPYLDCGITRVQATNINRQNLLLSKASSKTVKFISYMEPTMNANLPLATNGDIDITLLPTASLFGDTGLWLNEEFTCGWETTTKNSYFVSRFVWEGFREKLKILEHMTLG